MNLRELLRERLPPGLYYAAAAVGRTPRRLALLRSPAGRRRSRILCEVKLKAGLQVQHGPFRGMRYLRAASWGDDLAAKLIGSYEAELHAVIDELATTRRYARVINVGCAEGYYAVGLARLLPAADVFAFDIDPRAQYLCRRLAARNRVDHRVHVAGECTPAMLEELLREHTLVVVDCEGCERHLLQPAGAPRLAHADIIVELHEFLEADMADAVCGPFRTTHGITIVASTERDHARYPALRGLSPADRREAVAEHRPGPMRWAVLRALRTTSDA